MIAPDHKASCNRGRRVFLAVIMYALLSGVFAGRACAEPRVALVVGVSAYTQVPPLANTRADAGEIAAALRRLGFETELVLDPTRSALEEAVQHLGDHARGAEAAVFYFAGHGLEIGGRTWLIPVDAHLASNRELPFNALDTGLVLDQLDGAAKVSLLFLDACRDNPFRMQLARGGRGVRSTGERPQASSGSLIAYATAPGMEAADGAGPHSPFTAALLKHIERPGLTVQQVMNAVRSDVRAATHGQQVPWDSSSLDGDFYFRPPAPAPAAIPVAPAAPDVETMFFDSIKDSTDPSEWRAYLDRFPNGRFAPLARLRLPKLQAKAPAAVTPPAPPAVVAAQPDDETGLFDQIKTSPKADDWRRYLAQYPNGRFAALARLRLAKLAPPPDPARPARPAAGDDQGTLLTARLRDLQPWAKEADLLADARRFADHPADDRAFAVHPGSGRGWIGAGDGAQTEDLTLERCAFQAGHPCALIARNGEVFSPGPDGAWPVRAMSRLDYAGVFDPDRIPLISAATRSRADVRGYASMRIKAAAIRIDGGLFVATGAGQREAEQNALLACRDDPARRGAGCFLYAIGDDVVLTQTFENPATPATPPAQASLPAVEAIAEAIARLRPSEAGVIRARYGQEREHKAIAQHLSSGRSFRWSVAATEQQAQRWALEGCQLTFGGPCVLVAVDLRLVGDRPAAGTPQPMERLAYQGPFRIDRVPIGLERYDSVRGYGDLPGGKAIVIRPERSLVEVVSGMPRDAEAERVALQRCNRPDDPAPCFVYASGNQVVVSQRRTEALP